MTDSEPDEKTTQPPAGIQATAVTVSTARDAKPMDDEIRDALFDDAFQALVDENNRLHRHNGAVGALAALTMLSGRRKYALAMAIDGESAEGKSFIAERAAELVDDTRVIESTVISRAGLAAIEEPAVLVLDEVRPSPDLLALIRQLITKGEARIFLGKPNGESRHTTVKGPTAILHLHLPAHDDAGPNEIQNRNRYLAAKLDSSTEQALYRAEQTAAAFSTDGAAVMGRYAQFTTLFRGFNQGQDMNLAVVNDLLSRAIPKLQLVPAHLARLLKMVGNLVSMIVLLRQFHRPRNPDGKLVAEEADVADALKLLIDARVVDVRADSISEHDRQVLQLFAHVLEFKDLTLEEMENDLNSEAMRAWAATAWATGEIKGPRDLWDRVWSRPMIERPLKRLRDAGRVSRSRKSAKTPYLWTLVKCSDDGQSIFQAMLAAWNATMSNDSKGEDG